MGSVGVFSSLCCPCRLQDGGRTTAGPHTGARASHSGGSHMRGAEPWAASLAWFGKPQGADEAVEGTDGQLQPNETRAPRTFFSVVLILWAQPGPQ